MADNAASGVNEQQDGRAADQEPNEQHGDDRSNHAGAISAPSITLLAR